VDTISSDNRNTEGEIPPMCQMSCTLPSEKVLVTCTGVPTFLGSSSISEDGGHGIPLLEIILLGSNFGVVWGFPFKPVSSDLALLTTADKSVVLGCILGAPWKRPGTNAYWNKPVCRCGHTRIYRCCQCRCTSTTATHVDSIHSSRFWRGFTSSLSHRVFDASILVYPII